MMNTKRLLALLLAVVVVISLVPTVMAADGDSDSGLSLKKTATDNQDGTFTLTLESYATGTDATVEQVPVPSDIVLVLDESGSMNDCIECNHEITGTNNGPVVVNYIDGSFTGHKVYGSGEIFKYKTYRIIYPGDKKTREVKWCETCKGWYSTTTGHDDGGNHGGARWVPITKSTQTSIEYRYSSTNKNVTVTTYNADGTTSTTTQKTKYKDTSYYVEDADKNTEYDWVCEVPFYCVCDHDTERWDVLTSSLKNFVDEIYADSVADNVENRIAIIGYGNSGRDYTNGQYISVTTVDAKNQLYQKIEGLKKNEATNTADGIVKAAPYFSDSYLTPGESRNRVMILFTDGAPGSGYHYFDGTPSSTCTYDSHNNDWTNPGIAAAKSIKDTGATVYTVGLFPGANASNPGSLPAHTHGSDADGQQNEKFFDNANRFLHLVSSNYLSATNMDTLGSLNENVATVGSYYMSAEDESGLYSIFDKLANVVTPGTTTVTLNSSAVVKDVITPYFTIPSGDASVTAWLEDYDGENTWTKVDSSVSKPGDQNAQLKVSVNGDTVTVTNFDFAGNYVHIEKDSQNNTYYEGQKLVLQIIIKPVDGFLGGDDVVTNTTDSAVYASSSDTEPVARFEVPKVDIELEEINPSALDGYIYISQVAELPHVANMSKYVINGTEYDIDGIRNAYVDITYTITGDNQNLTHTIPAGKTLAQTSLSWEAVRLIEDTEYTVNCKIISKNETANTTHGDDTAKVYVYKPEITFKDSVLNLNDTPVYATQNLLSTVVWKNSAGQVPTTEIAAKLGTAPTLEYTYDTTPAPLTAETPVTVTEVWVRKASNTGLAHILPDDMKIIDYVTFYRDACSFTGCEHTEKTTVNKGSTNFIVHLKTFDLTISKTGADMTADPNQTFIFRITGPNDFSMDVVINGNNSVKIKNLPVANYTVKELTDWSWRYTPTTNDQTANATNHTVTFNNRRDDTKWLDGNSHADNTFIGVANTPSGSTN